MVLDRIEFMSFISTMDINMITIIVIYIAMWNRIWGFIYAKNGEYTRDTYIENLSDIRVVEYLIFATHGFREEGPFYYQTSYISIGLI